MDKDIVGVNVFGSTKSNKEDIAVKYKGKKYIETTIVIRNEISSEFAEKLEDDILLINPLAKKINDDVEEIISDSFNSDIVSINTRFRI